MSMLAERIETLLYGHRFSMSECPYSVIVSGAYFGGYGKRQRIALDTQLRTTFPDAICIKINSSTWHWVIAKY